MQIRRFTTRALLLPALLGTSFAANADQQLMRATITGTVASGFDAYSNSILLGASDGTNLFGLAGSVTILYDASGFSPNGSAAPHWAFTHSPNWPAFLGTAGESPILSASFTLNGIEVPLDVSGTYEHARLYVENYAPATPTSNTDSWTLSGGDTRFTWCPNDSQCAESIGLQYYQQYGEDSFGGQQPFDPARPFTATAAPGRAIVAYVRMIQSTACLEGGPRAGMCPEGRFTDGQTHWMDFQLNGSQLTVEAVQAVPEPETYAMLAAGLGLLGLASRRRRS